ncbi:hypothetical protein QBC41DRAFT_311820 [Cercophora samala]|uniref:Uncharacterized protein n=1 Tax=Cercophora samala TaxID=330535 RepID=A0AA40DFL4_9PEZI|nr:hypothetical protein QBC41DRAFT_311820 [Cercophora samala]
MSSRILTRALPAMRLMSTTAVRRDVAAVGVPLPARKPVGALRGGLFGFFFGSTLAGAGVYYYAVQEYKASNELLTEDIYTLQRSVERLSEYITAMEQKMELLEKKKKR